MSETQNMSREAMSRGKHTAEAGRRDDLKRIAMNATKPLRVIYVNPSPNFVPQIDICSRHSTIDFLARCMLETESISYLLGRSRM